MRKLLWVIGGVAALLVAAFLLLRTPDTDPAAMRAKYGGPPSQFVTLSNGQTVHLRDEGPRDAPVIMLLHGSSSDLHTWASWTERLAGDYRIVRFDQRGHGLTGPAHDGAYAQTVFAEDVDGVADALGIDRFILAGNSMGGAVALRYALAHPDRLAGLVLLDASNAPVRDDGDGNLAFTLLRIPGLNRTLIEIMPRSIIARSLSQSVSVQGVVTDATIDRYWELARYPGNRTATIARASQPRETFRSADLARLEVPVLILWGEEDQLVPIAHARWFARHLPNATLRSYPGVGHLPMEEAPDRSVADVRDWIVAREVRGNRVAAASSSVTTR